MLTNKEAQAVLRYKKMLNNWKKAFVPREWYLMASGAITMLHLTDVIGDETYFELITQLTMDKGKVKNDERLKAHGSSDKSTE